MDMKNTKVEFGFPDFIVMIEDTLQKSFSNNVSNFIVFQNILQDYQYQILFIQNVIKDR